MNIKLWYLILNLIADASTEICHLAEVAEIRTLEHF